MTRLLIRFLTWYCPYRHDLRLCLRRAGLEPYGYPADAK